MHTNHHLTTSPPHHLATLPTAKTWVARVALGVLLIAALLGVQWLLGKFVQDYVARIIVLAGINVILAVSLNLINGITGQFSLGHAGFMAIGAYVSAIISFYLGPKLNLPPDALFALAMICGAIAAGLAGWLVGLPSLRLRGDYLAIVTLGFGEIIRVVIGTINEVGGVRGFNGLPFLVDFAWVFACAAACILMMRNLADSKIGREMRAVRDDEVAAEAIGINTTKVKVWAFVISALWAGIAGALQTHFNGSAHPDSFGFLRSVEIVVMVVLGGLGSITGAALAAVVLTFLGNILRSVDGAFVVGVLLILFAAGLSLPRYWPEIKTNPLRIANWLWAPLLCFIGVVIAYFQAHIWLEANIASVRYVIYALILIVLMLLRPQGLMGRSEFGAHWWRRRQQKPPAVELA